ncbi:hypothetical protein AK830_g11252 [Neonectria ditissima]|uniref:Uncharacterized protein n=2 Tax=Eukaryota TaxID=2759 RepID=A0A0P7ARK8_9HYPO|nr:hypothetical protein AK830_g11252 [Neonectria ditissima]
MPKAKRRGQSTRFTHRKRQRQPPAASNSPAREHEEPPRSSSAEDTQGHQQPQRNGNSAIDYSKVDYRKIDPKVLDAAWTLLNLSRGTREPCPYLQENSHLADNSTPPYQLPGTSTGPVGQLPNSDHLPQPSPQIPPRTETPKPAITPRRSSRIIKKGYISPKHREYSSPELSRRSSSSSTPRQVHLSLPDPFVFGPGETESGSKSAALRSTSLSSLSRVNSLEEQPPLNGPSHPAVAPIMDRNTEASSRNFGLRPKPPDLQLIIRPYEPVEPPMATQQPSPSSQEETCSTTDSHRSSSSTVPRSPVAQTETSITSNGDGHASRTPTPPGPPKRRRSSGRTASKTSPARSPIAGLLGEGTDSSLPRNNSFERAHRELWRQGTRAVRRADGSVEEIDVIHWMMTRKGGSNSAWPQLIEGQKAIENMRKETMDIGKIWRLADEKQEQERLREERRLANKRRYQPRSQWAKEKAAKKAAAESAAKRSREDAELTEVDEASQEGDVLGVGEPAAKRLKVDAVKGSRV